MKSVCVGECVSMCVQCVCTVRACRLVRVCALLFFNIQVCVKQTA